QGDRVRLAMKLFDSEGVALLQTMKGGAAAIRAYRDEARALGASLSQSAVRGVEAANDSVGRLKTLFTGLRDQTVAGLAPALKAAVDHFTDMGRQALEAHGGADKLGQVMAGKLLNAVESVTKAAVWFADVMWRVFNPRAALRSDELVAEIEKVQRQLDMFSRIKERIASGDETREAVTSTIDKKIADANAVIEQLRSQLAEVGSPFDTAT